MFLVARGQSGRFQQGTHQIVQIRQEGVPAKGPESPNLCGSDLAKAPGGQHILEMHVYSREKYLQPTGSPGESGGPSRFFFFSTASAAHGSSQARDQIRANSGYLTHCAGSGIELAIPWRQARSLTHCATVGNANPPGFFLGGGGLHSWHMEVPRLGIKSERSYDLHHSHSNAGSLAH